MTLPRRQHGGFSKRDPSLGRRSAGSEIDLRNGPRPMHDTHHFDAVLLLRGPLAGDRLRNDTGYGRPFAARRQPRFAAGLLHAHPELYL
jgi:hypothetical protein